MANTRGNEEVDVCRATEASVSALMGAGWEYDKKDAGAINRL